MGTAAAPTDAVLTWFAEWGQLYYVGVQVLFWIAIAVAALMIALQYRRFVSYKVGDTKAVTAADAKVESEVEAFVE